MSPSAGTTWAMPGLFRHEHPERRALGFEVRLFHVAEVLAVDLERHRPVGADDELVGVVDVEDVRRALLALTGERPGGHLGQAPRLDLARRDEVEAELELRLRRDAKRNAAHVAVRMAVGDKGEGDAAEALDLHHRLEPSTALGEDSRQGARKGEVARALARRPPERVDAAHELGIDPEAAAEREPAAVDSPERDPPLCPRRRERPRGRDRVTRDAERAREDARRPARYEPDRQVAFEAVYVFYLSADHRED